MISSNLKGSCMMSFSAATRNEGPTSGQSATRGGLRDSGCDLSAIWLRVWPSAARLSSEEAGSKVKRLNDVTKRRLVLKGKVMREDAEIAVEHGSGLSSRSRRMLGGHPSDNPD